MIDIPTALTERETKTLQDLARDRRVVEAGSLLGFSTVAMAQVARQVVAIDPHDGYPYWQPRPTWEAFTHNIQRYGVGSRVHPVIGMGEDHLKRFTGEFSFLDLTGEYEDTWRNLVAAPGRVVACHDYARNGCHGATKAVDFYARRYGCRVSVVDTLAVIER